MRRDFTTQNPNMFFHKLLSTLCVLTLLASTIIFLYLFFYQDFERAYHSIKISKQNLPIYESPDIAIPQIAIESKKSNIKQNELIDDESSRAAEKIFIAYELGDTSLSSRLIADFLIDYPSSRFRHKVRLIGAKLMNDRSDYTGAMKYIQKILSETGLSNEDYSESVLLLGEIARERKQYDSYIQSFLEQAYFKANEPIKSQLAFYLGYVLLHKGDYKSALSYFNNVIGENGVLGRADLYVAQIMRPETINSLEIFITQYPSSKNYDYAKKTFIKESKLQAEILTTRGYLDNAMRYYKKIIKYFSDSEDGDVARIGLANLYYQKQEYKNAFSTLNEVLNNQNNYQDPEALFILGKLSFETNQLEKALFYFRTLVEKYPTSPYITKAQDWQQLILDSLRS